MFLNWNMNFRHCVRVSRSLTNSRRSRSRSASQRGSSSLRNSWRTLTLPVHPNTDISGKSRQIQIHPEPPESQVRHSSYIIIKTCVYPSDTDTVSKSRSSGNCWWSLEAVVSVGSLIGLVDIGNEQVRVSAFF